MKHPKAEDNGQLIAQGNTIMLSTETVDYNELFILSVLETINEKAHEYYFDTPFVNELFRDYFLPLICIEHYLNDKDVHFIDATKASNELRGILCDYAEIHGIKYKGKTNIFISRIKYCAYVALTYIYLGLKQMIKKSSPKGDICEENKTISICRTPAAYKKIIKIYDKNVFQEEKPGEGNVYNLLSKKSLWDCLKNGRKQASKEIKKLKTFLFDRNYENIYYASLSYYKIRVVHTFFYENVIEKIIQDGKYSTFITGNNLDRFAVIEEGIARRNNLELICIPHGIEYGYRFPKCFIGDKFFTTSKYTASYLNELYSTNKFVFDKDIANRIFRVSSDLKLETRIVYFSEPREPEVNILILKELIKFFKERNTTLYIKHHPKDDLSDYKEVECDIVEIKDLNEAICNNICLSRKSTTLLEGVYNQSQCAAIIVNEKDNAIFKTFPSLQDENIEVFYSIKDAANWSLMHQKAKI